MKGAKQCGIIILAGGRSSRLGSPKQLLTFRENSLILHSIHAALETDLGPVMVVTGANRQRVETELGKTGVDHVYNAEWQEGMASSLRTGLQAMMEKYPDTKMVIFMVCDQPFVTKSHLLCLMERHSLMGKPITASAYAGRAGTPALFEKVFFEKLLQLKGDKGARMLITAFPEQTELVAFENGEIDIDTVEDYERLLKFE
jgi:molybdenum cofactor cytidylyltransferase